MAAATPSSDIHPAAVVTPPAPPWPPLLDTDHHLLAAATGNYQQHPHTADASNAAATPCLRRQQPLISSSSSSPHNLLPLQLHSSSPSANIFTMVPTTSTVEAARGTAKPLFSFQTTIVSVKVLCTALDTMMAEICIGVIFGYKSHLISSKDVVSEVATNTIGNLKGGLQYRDDQVYNVYYTTILEELEMGNLDSPNRQMLEVTLYELRRDM